MLTSTGPIDAIIEGLSINHCTTRSCSLHFKKEIRYYRYPITTFCRDDIVAKCIFDRGFHSCGGNAVPEVG